MIAINSLVNVIHEMEPNSLSVKICAAIPLISAIVLVAKEKQLSDVMHEQWQNLKELHGKLTPTQIEQISSKNKEFISACDAQNQFIATMVRSPYSFVPRIACVAALVLLPLNYPALLGSFAVLACTVIPHYSYTFPNKTVQEIIKEYPNISTDIENRLKNKEVLTKRGI